MLVSPTINNVHGRILSITGTDPAAGAEISEIVPARRRWRFHGIRFTLITDVNVADRTVYLQISDGTNVLIFITHTQTQAASITRSYNFHPRPDAASTISTQISIPLPYFTLGAGYGIITSTNNIQVGDQFSAIHLLAEEWIDP
ncbi:hypothetical protein ES705_37780 [subsurface metagenome]